MGGIAVASRARTRTVEPSGGPGLTSARLVIPFRLGISRTGPSEPDAVAVRLVARVRIALALIAAGTGSFVPDLTGHQKVVFLVLGLAWVPAAAVALFAADQDGNPVAVFGGPVADLAALAVINLLVPAAAVPALFGYLGLVAFGTYTGGRMFGALLSAASAVVVVGARQVPDAAHRVDGSTAVLFSVALFSIVFLLDRTTTVQSRTAARSARFESKSEAILSRVADAVVVTDAHGCVLQWSPAAERILGRRAEDATGHPCQETAGLYVGERKLDCSNGCPLLSIPGADDVLGLEAWRPCEDGSRQPLLVNASPVPGPDGTPVEVVHSLRDVTRLKQAEEAKTLFLATASHELKTPLTVIAGFSATLAADKQIDEDTRSMALDAINRRAKELSKIVDRLLLSSRIESGRVDVADGPVELVPLVTERVDSVRQATGHAADLDVAVPVPVARGDGQAVVTVIDHLLDNAIKYSPGGEPLHVRLWGDEREAHVSVADGGIGMDEEQAAHCFDKFWQAESSDVRRFGGTGIGLYIVRSLIEAMGGRIDVRSEKGAGSMFTVTLRRMDAPDAAAPSDEAVGRGERTSIREFMRQIGVPEKTGR